MCCKRPWEILQTLKRVVCMHRRMCCLSVELVKTQRRGLVCYLITRLHASINYKMCAQKWNEAQCCSWSNEFVKPGAIKGHTLCTEHESIQQICCLCESKATMLIKNRNVLLFNYLGSMFLKPTYLHCYPINCDRSAWSPRCSQTLANAHFSVII